jgi:exosortase
VALTPSYNYASRPRLIWITALALLACYAATLRGMFDQWIGDEDMGHGLIVPFVVAWIVWRERAKWRAVPANPNAWGLAMIAAAAAIQIISVLAGGLFVGSIAFVMSIAGVIVFLGGFGRLRAWAFPLALTVFMLPKLAIVYNQATLPLQLLASRMAAGMLTLSGMGVIREGNILDVGGNRIAVAEACNGIRYLLPLGFMGVLFAYLVDAKAWMRVALLAAAVPISIVANALRVAMAGASPKLAEGWLHTLMGLIIFVLCLAILALMQRLFNAAYGLRRA